MTTYTKKCKSIFAQPVMANPFPSSNHAETCIIPVTIYCINIWWEADLQGGGGENVKIYMRVRPL